MGGGLANLVLQPLTHCTTASHGHDVAWLQELVADYAASSSDEALELAQRQHKRLLSTLRFFGALHARALLAERVVSACFHQLLPLALNAEGTTSAASAASHTRAESACILLHATGPSLDRSPSGASLVSGTGVCRCGSMGIYGGNWNREG